MKQLISFFSLAIFLASCLNPNSITRLSDNPINIPIKVNKVVFEDTRGGSELISINKIKDNKTSFPVITESLKKTVTDQILNASVGGTEYTAVVIINDALIISENEYKCKVVLTIELTNNTKDKAFYEIETYQNLTSKAMFASNEKLYKMFETAFQNAVHLGLDELKKNF